MDPCQDLTVPIPQGEIVITNVPRYAKKPGFETGFAPKAVPVGQCPDKSILNQIASGMGILDKASACEQHGRTVAHIQQPEGAQIPVLNALHQRAVRNLYFAVRGGVTDPLISVGKGRSC